MIEILLRHFLLLFWINLLPKVDFISIDLQQLEFNARVKLLTTIVKSLKFS